MLNVIQTNLLSSALTQLVFICRSADPSLLCTIEVDMEQLLHPPDRRQHLWELLVAEINTKPQPSQIYGQGDTCKQIYLSAHLPGRHKHNREDIKEKEKLTKDQTPNYTSCLDQRELCRNGKAEGDAVCRPHFLPQAQYSTFW